MKKLIDAPIAQLIRDLEERGLLDRTLVVLASEFGRDAMTEGKVGKEVKDQAINIPDVMTEPRHYGMHRHFTAAGSVLMFGGGIKKGFVYGKTADERPCTTIENPVPIEDLHATIYHALGIPPDTAYVVEKRPGLRHEGRQGQSRSRSCSPEDRHEDHRREFLAAAAAAPIASPILLGMQDKAGTKAPVLGQRRLHLRSRSTTGASCPPRIKWGNTHGVVEDSQGHIYVHHTVHATSESADTMVVFDAKGKFVRSWGKEFRGVAHGLHIRKEGRDEFLYLTVNAANPQMTPQPAMQAVVVKTTLKGEIVWKIQGPPDVDAYKPAADGAAEALQPDQRRDRAERRRLRRRRLRLVLHQSVQQQGGVHPHVRRQGIGARASSPSRTASGWTRAARRPMLVVADRRNNRLQRFTLDGKHIDFVPGFRLPCHFDERKGVVVIPDLHGRVTLIDKNNQIVEHLGDSNARNWNNPLRTRAARQVHPGPVHLPARRLLRPRRQYLRRRMGRGRPGDELRKAEAASRPGALQILPPLASSPRRSFRYSSSASRMIPSASSGPSRSSTTTCLCSSTL